MQLRSRKTNDSDPDRGDYSDIANAHVQKKEKEKALFTRIQSASKGIMLLSGVLLAAVTVYVNESPKPYNWWLLLTLFSTPVVSLLAVAAGFGNSLPHQRWIALGTAGAVLGNQLPTSVSVFFVFAGATLFHLASRPEGIISDADNQGRLKAAMAGIFLTVVLLFDNFFVWVVAATYEPGIHGTPQRLQDNGQLLQQHFLNDVLGLSKQPVVLIRSIVNAQWALTSSISVTFGVADLQMVKNRTVWGMAIHALLTLAALRAIRVVSFLLTVLPSQNPHCYRHRFPPPPEDWISWIEVGMRPQSNGGCNDLIVSGHATVLTTFACLSASVSGHPLFALSIWSMLAIDFCLEVYEGFHYSVDMWLGALFGCMLWRILAPLENIDSHVCVTKKLKPLSSATIVDIVAYATPALAAYVDITFVAHNHQSYLVIGLLTFAGFQAVRKGFTHHLQHVLFCLMFLALAIWL
jgi:PAP2 superfamily C-terminal